MCITFIFIVHLYQANEKRFSFTSRPTHRGEFREDNMTANQNISASTYNDTFNKKVIVLGTYSNEYGRIYETIFLDGFAPTVENGEIYSEMSLDNFLKKEDGRFVRRIKNDVLFEKIELCNL